MTKLILGIILKGATIFDKERARYFEKEAQGLLDKINEVEDSDFYSKDMEAKGVAEREINQKSQRLAHQYLKEKK